MVFIAAVLLFGSLVLEHAEAYARGGSTQVTAAPGGALTIAAMSAGFAVVCYAGGSALASIMLG
jgi:hypothetical protein